MRVSFHRVIVGGIEVEGIPVALNTGCVWVSKRGHGPGGIRLVLVRYGNQMR